MIPKRQSSGIEVTGSDSIRPSAATPISERKNSVVSGMNSQQESSSADNRGPGIPLFDFSGAEPSWYIVNDNVMGGVSKSSVFVDPELQRLSFSGAVSLENNGGFASVRSRPVEVNLKNGDSITARIRGDGREYTMNLYVPRGSGGYSFRQSFKTKKGEWIDVSFPVNTFVATYRGRVFPNQKLDPNKVNSLGFLLGDKKAGPFKLEIEWIKVITAE